MQILYEDNHLIAVNKNVSDIVQGDKTGDKPLSDIVKYYIKKKYDKPGNVFLGVIHRLDRPVSGVVLFARTGKALSRMNELFRNREIDKRYWAVVKNKPPQNEALLTHYIVRKRKNNKSYCYDMEVENAKPAKMTYQIVNQSDNYYLLEIELHTGRHHQIRSQLSKIGSPVKGDLKYGFPRSNPGGGIHLHAREISFIHPVQKKPVKIIAPPPDDTLWNVLTT